VTYSDHIREDAGFVVRIVPTCLKVSIQPAQFRVSAPRARQLLGRNWSGTVQVKQDHQLIRDGPYRFVRHPIYTGVLMAILGTAVAVGHWCGLFAVLIAFGSFWRKLTLEERFMWETFGSVYEEYRARTAALIPFLF
jgi:protein-S-isoprenylcysteine O-methyltransferase Ste14